jgi:hypothetical protein
MGVLAPVLCQKNLMQVRVQNLLKHQNFRTFLFSAQILHFCQLKPVKKLEGPILGH